MRPLARLTRSIDRTLESSVRPKALSHFCTTCRQTAPFSTSTTRAADAPKKSNQRLEGLRRKIWGTDQPPGREDPYDPDSPIRQIEETESKPKRPGQKATAETTAEGDDAVSTKAAGPKRVIQGSKDDYKPATTWEGMEWIGSPEWVWKQKPIPNFEGLLSANPNQQAEDLEAALRRALIKVVARRKSYRGLVIAAKKEKKEAWTDTVSLDIDKDRKLVLTKAKAKPVVKKTVVTNGGKPVHPAWFSATIVDPGFKFQFARKFMKDTGVRISDFALQQESPYHIFKAITQQLKVAKKEKLAETLKNDARLGELSNVKIVDRRVTPIDKEKEVGRWKLIEDELIQRGLPVTGKPVVQ